MKIRQPERATDQQEQDEGRTEMPSASKRAAVVATRETINWRGDRRQLQGPIDDSGHLETPTAIPANLSTTHFCISNNYSRSLYNGRLHHSR